MKRVRVGSELGFHSLRMKRVRVGVRVRLPLAVNEKVKDSGE